MNEVIRKEMVERAKVLYIAEDGTEFDSKASCLDYELNTVRKEVKKVRHCDKLEGKPNFDGGDSCCENDFYWYFPETKEDIDLLNKAYGDGSNFYHGMIGKWICVEVSHDGCDAYLSSLDHAINYAREILDALGYDIVVTERK